MRYTEREPNTQYVLSLSYGKDSIACLGAIEQLGWPLDRIVHAEVWATDTIPADLPPMVEFKAKADEWIWRHYGIRIEHICATDNGIKLTYDDVFYRRFASGKRNDLIYGFPYQRGNWCQSRLKRAALGAIKSVNSIQYIGIAADEPERVKRHTKPGYAIPLVEAGWTEADCRAWCEERGMLSPLYTTATRGGCWFCHNQGVDQLRLLRKNYPEYWEILLRWDSDSPVSYHPDGHTVHDFDRRFAAEDAGRINPNDRRFRWDMLDMPEQMRMEI